MRSMCGQFVWIVLLPAVILDTTPVRGQIWKQFVPTSRDAGSRDPRAADAGAGGQRTPSTVREANDGQPQVADVNSDSYAITQESGPWLIVAASFSGDGAEKQAQALAAELRSSFHLHAYVHEMQFKFRDDSENSGNFG